MLPIDKDNNPINLNKALVGHYFLSQPELPPIQQGLLYTYVVAQNGLFLYGKRSFVEVLMPLVIAPDFYSRPGLFPARPYLKLDCPRVPQALVIEMLEKARQARNRQGWPLEILFHLSVKAANSTQNSSALENQSPPAEPHWHLHLPQQIQFANKVIPVSNPRWGGSDNSYETTLFECHSHSLFAPIFSELDNQDESGFRLYGVLGNLFEQPALRLRVGLYSHFWEIPSCWVCEPVADLEDCVAREWVEATT